jgi:rRNA maturation endonuclease Nob1
MSELFEGRDWEFVEELVAPVLDYHVYGQRCPDCGWIFTLGYGSHKWKYCPMCGKYRERSEDGA